MSHLIVQKWEGKQAVRKNRKGKERGGKTIRIKLMRGYKRTGLYIIIANL